MTPTRTTPLERALAPFRARLRRRLAFDLAAVALVAGLVVDALLVGALRVAGAATDAAWLLAPPLVALVAALGVALWRRPSTWDAARTVDGLGLAERATSALHATAVEHSAAPLLERQALEGVRTLEPRQVRTRPDMWRFRALALATVALVAALLVPLPTFGDGAAHAAEQAAINDAREGIEALAAEVEAIAPEPEARRVREELDALDEALAHAESVEEAASAIEQAQERIAQLAGGEQYASDRTLDALASAWADSPRLSELADALRARDQAAISDALDALAAALPSLSEGEREQLQVALQAGANLARDIPEVGGALREAAAAGGTEGGGESGGAAGDTGAGEAFAAAQAALSRAAGQARSLSAVRGAITSLGEARAGLGAGSASGEAMVSGGDSGTGSGSAGASGAGGEGAASGSGSGEAGGTGTGRGDGSGDGAGEGSGGGSGAGSGSGSGEGNGAGSGSGSRTGSGGAGAGGRPTPGDPDATGGAGSPGSGTAPSDVGAIPYDPIYAPRLLGGEGGPSSGLSGEAGGADGGSVEIDQSPLTRGAVRPYNEVYGDYEAAARQALSRSPLPPALEALVESYFGAIAPPDGGNQ